MCTGRLCCEPKSSLVSYSLRESAAPWQPVILSMGPPKSPMLSCACIGKGPDHGERENLRNQSGKSVPHDGPPHRHAQRALLLRSGSCPPESVVGATDDGNAATRQTPMGGGARLVDDGSKPTQSGRLPSLKEVIRNTASRLPLSNKSLGVSHASDSCHAT
jgi:hypothetical protein